MIDKTLIMYGTDFNPKIFTDITMPAKLFVAQILASDVLPRLTILSIQV